MVNSLLNGERHLTNAEPGYGYAYHGSGLTDHEVCHKFNKTTGAQG